MTQPGKAQWCAEALDTLAAAGTWSLVDFFANVPEPLHGSLLLALTRAQALLVRFSNGRRMLLLYCHDAAAVWQLQGEQRCIATQRIRQDNAWLLALMPQGGAPSESASAPYPATVRAAPGRQLEVQLGPLRIIGLTSSRSWDWAWAPSLGPLFLSIYLARSAAQIGQWLHDHLPEGYVLDGNGACAARTAPIHTQLRHSDEIRVHDGVIHFAHGYYRHVEAQDNARAIYLLRKLARAELGELTFDLFDGDYGSLCATGYSCASLNQYLDRRPWYDRKKPHPWNNQERLHIHVPATRDAEDFVREALNRAVGLPADAPYRAALSQPIQQLPRWITVHLPPGVHQFDCRVHVPDDRRSPRIDWWVQGPSKTIDTV